MEMTEQIDWLEKQLLEVVYCVSKDLRCCEARYPPTCILSTQTRSSHHRAPEVGRQKKEAEVEPGKDTTGASVSQTMFRTVSTVTLGKLLRDKEEHIWRFQIDT